MDSNEVVHQTRSALALIRTRLTPPPTRPGRRRSAPPRVRTARAPVWTGGSPDQSIGPGVVPVCGDVSTIAAAEIAPTRHSRSTSLAAGKPMPEVAAAHKCGCVSSRVPTGQQCSSNIDDRGALLSASVPAHHPTPPGRQSFLHSACMIDHDRDCRSYPCLPQPSV